MNQAREIALEDYMHFHADTFAALEQGIRETFEELEEDWDSVCTKERDRSAITHSISAI